VSRPPWITEADVASSLTMAEAIDVLERSYRQLEAGEAATMPRAHLREGAAILHAVGGTLPAEGVAGTKVWIHTPGGAQPILVLFDLGDGKVRAMVEAFAMGQMRTAATSGLATRHLAREDSTVLAVLGTGKQSISQAEAILCERAIERIQLFGRDPGRRGGCAEAMRSRFEVEVVEFDDVAATVAGADIVTTTTRAADPILFGAMLEPGQHLNAVGAIVPTRRELSPDCVGRCDLVVVDSTGQAEDDAGELRAAVQEDLLAWDAVRSLGSLTAVPTPARTGEDQITLFKSLGIGVSDVALGAELFARFERTGATDRELAAGTTNTKEHAR
jgi:ornithine cyclodeaminase